MTFRKRHILLAEDAEADVLHVKRAFKKALITQPLLVVSSGEETMDYLEGAGQFADRKKYPVPFLLLLDLKMPGMDGFDALERIRKDAAFDTMIVIMLTAFDQPGNIHRAYSLGANSFIAKPMTPHACRTLIDYWSGLNHTIHTLDYGF